MSRLLTASCLLLLAACSPRWDLQGHDPRDYYAEHPIQNTVETHTLAQVVVTSDNCMSVPATEMTRLRQALGDISPLAVRSLALSVPADAPDRQQRQCARLLAGAMKKLGFAMQPRVRAASELAMGTAEVVLAYSAAVPPKCPDWRASPVTTYSNANTGNFGCATAVNLGKMVADPQDLVRGSGTNRIDIERTYRVIQQDRTPTSASAATGAGTSTGTGSAAAASTGTP